MERKGNGNEKNELFNRMVKAGQRTYFITVKEASNKNKYVTLTESKLIEKDKFERHHIMVFQEKMGDFVSALQDAYAAIA